MKISELLIKPLWQMSGQEYVQLHTYACRLDGKESESAKTVRVRVTGVRGLAEYLECCESTLYGLKREGVLDAAVISRIGKKTVFDGEKARELAQAYTEAQRAARSNSIKEMEL